MKIAIGFFEKKWPKVQTPKSHISPKWGAIFPEQNPFLSGSLGPSYAMIGWAKWAPQGGELKKVPRRHARKIGTPFSGEKNFHDFL